MENIGRESHFLESYNVHEKPEVKKAGERKSKRTHRSSASFNRSERIEAHIERLEEIFLHPDEETRERRIKFFKEKYLYPEFLVSQNKDKFPESHFDFMLKQAQERGMEEVVFSEEEKTKERENVKERQKISLDAWINYLISDECQYPSDIKYFAMQGVLKLGSFNTNNYKFNERKQPQRTTTSFAEIDRESLSIVLGALDAKHHHRDVSSYSSTLLDLIDKKRSFGDMYSSVMKELDEKTDKQGLLPITDGKWKTFAQNSDPNELIKTLSGKRSNLCIADIGSATQYLSNGSVEVYFSNNHAGVATLPRIAIASKDEMGVYEIRGTYNKNEDIDPDISSTDILSKKAKTIKNGESFLKKDADMKRVTELYDKSFKVDNKTKEREYLKPELTKEDLIFLYELNDHIDGFGYKKDSRSAEIIDKRNIKDDLSYALDIPKEQISTTKEEALKGDINYHYGSLDLRGLTSAEGLTLPQSVGGSLDLEGLTSAEGLTLPQSVGGGLDLRGLTSAEGLTLPQSVGGYLYLQGLNHDEKNKLRKKYPQLKIK